MAAALRPLGATARSAARAHSGWLRQVPALTLFLFLAPLGAGLVFTLLPAFGWLPALGGHVLSLAPWRALFAAPELAGALGLTLVTGVGATVAATALVLLFVAACQGSRLFAGIRRLLAPLLAVPHAALALGFAFLIAPSGWIVRLLSQTATLWGDGWSTPPDIATLPDPHGIALGAALLIKETPYLLLMTLAALDQVQAGRALAVARSLGYGPVMAWLKVVLPQVYPQIRLPIFAALAYSLSVVDMAIILAPSTPPPLAVLLVRWFGDPDLARRFTAAAGATLQFAVVAATILLWLGAERALAAGLRSWLAGGRRGGSGRLAHRAAGTAIVAVFALAGLALAGMALWSVATRWRYPDLLPAALTPATWLRHADALSWPFGVTLVIALVVAVTALALVLGCLENEQRHGLHPTARALWLLYLPLLVPQVSFLFGLQVLLSACRLDGSWAGLAWSHLLFVLPYVFLSLADPWRSLDERYARSARCLGASPARVFWRIKLPMLARPAMFAFAVGVAVSVAQYLPTLFAGGGRFATLTTEAVTLAAGGDRRVIGVYALLQALLPVLVFGVVLRLTSARRGSAHGPGMPT